ncbi:MAG: hypothetical protein GY934_08355 [Gammaproteobacteria bacterium]|nr:hypothetical protein [Gammaproteobacteria bacterium]
MFGKHYLALKFENLKKSAVKIWGFHKVEYNIGIDNSWGQRRRTIDSPPPQPTQVNPNCTYLSKEAACLIYQAFNQQVRTITASLPTVEQPGNRVSMGNL